MPTLRKKQTSFLENPLEVFLVIIELPQHLLHGLVIQDVGLCLPGAVCAVLRGGQAGVGPVVDLWKRETNLC